MARPPQIPRALTRGPFDLERARQYGLTKRQLTGTSWRRLGTGIYVWSEIADDPIVELTAAMCRLPDAAVLSGHSAAWLHGLDTTLRHPIEVSVPKTNHMWQRSGLVVRRCSIRASETAIHSGLPVTSAVRTVAALGCRFEVIDAVALLDMAMHRRLVKRGELCAWVEKHPGHRGIRNLRTAIDLAEPASESVMETRLRLVLVLAGVPRPKVQISLYDDIGDFIGRPDLCYPRSRLAIEYDGATHRESLAADNRRQNRLIDAGYRILRFTAGDVLTGPAAVVSVVRRSLALHRVDPGKRDH